MSAPQNRLPSPGRAARLCACIPAPPPPLHPVQMRSIYPLMGVCPQHDLLWEQLTGEEHLLFYGRLKGLKGEPSGCRLGAVTTVQLSSGWLVERRLLWPPGPQG